MLKYRLLDENPKEAFLYVIVSQNAMSYDKKKALSVIVKKHPDILENISDDELLTAFFTLAEYSQSRNEILSFVELDWVSLYVKDEDARSDVEQIIYSGFLRASDGWDKARKDFKEWTLSETTKKALAMKVLQDAKLGSKRKMQLAKEFGLPSDDYARDYFKTLLWGRHYVAAEALKLSGTDDLAIEVIVDDLNSLHINDALNIAQRFLSHREDILKELEEIRGTLNSQFQL